MQFNNLNPPYRFEVTIRNESEISEITALLEENKIGSIYLTHKTPAINPIQIAEKIREQLPDLDIITTLSTKYYQTVDQITEILEEAKDPDNKILIVSGAKKGNIDSTQILSRHHDSDLNLYCVFNPYLQDKDLILEKQRLTLKLQNPKIKGIFLQIGTDTRKLKSGIEYIKQIAPTIEIGSSLLFPKQNFLDRMKIKPWKDVLLEENYINNLTYALHKTEEVFLYCTHNNILLLIQLIPLNRDNIEEFFKWKNALL